jgi:hypothetical protein
LLIRRGLIWIRPSFLREDNDALSLVWVIGAFAITFGVLMLILAFELRSHRERRHEMLGAPGMAPSR